MWESIDNGAQAITIFAGEGPSKPGLAQRTAFGVGHIAASERTCYGA